jgi:hypothetical protein
MEKTLAQHERSVPWLSFQVWDSKRPPGKFLALSRAVADKVYRINARRPTQK